MTSKEALEILSFTYNSPFAKVAREKLEQDLERLEKINEVWHKNEVMESVDINGNHLQEVYDFLRKTIKDLEKYKKAIKLIKDKNVQIYDLLNSSSVESYNNLSWSTYDFDGLELDKIEYELLKEVFNYEK